MSCKICGDDYHYCSSCEPFLPGDYGTCCNKCMEQTPLFQEHYRKFIEQGFTDQQLDYLLNDSDQGVWSYFKEMRGREGIYTSKPYPEVKVLL
jgi:hypothetical protein